MKAQYGILRLKKYKGQTVSWIEAHNERQKESYASNPDIHLERSKFNFHLVEPQGKYLGEADRMIREAGCRTRKDSVKVVEALITASPEFFEGKSQREIRLFFQRAVDFMKTRQDEATYISAVVHVDEKTPHIHLCFVPITLDDRLSAKEIVGNKKDLTKWQDDFWSYMVKFYPDLERGESASKTGRAHVPPRLFKDAVHLGKLQNKILDLIRDPNPLTAKKRAAEVEKLLGKYIPRAENLMSSMKKINRAIKELKAEVKALEKEKEASQESVLRKMEIMQQLQELEELKELIENIPDEILDTYKNKENLRKENEIAYE